MIPPALLGAFAELPVYAVPKRGRNKTYFPF
jgi:hypothetical protein